MSLSFVIPAYNEEKYISSCILSIHISMSENRDVQYEIIVVDNASTDSTAKYAENGLVSVIHEPHKGIMYARRAGCKAAKHDFIACVDADNLISPDWVGTAVGSFTDNNIVVVSGPPVFYGMSRIFRISMFFYILITRIAHEVLHPMIQGGNFIVRRTAMEQIGGYPINCEFYGEDTSLAHELSKVGAVIVNSKLRIKSSPRRIEHNGAIRTSWEYAINYLWVAILNRPWSQTHKDCR
jgi:glycosyltransferase involved in cell wall biosynthesis